MVGGHNSVMLRRPVHPLGKGDSWMATIIECTGSHYETQVMPYDKASVSYPKCVMAECGCGERQVLTASEAVCRCRSHGPGPGGAGVGRGNASLGRRVRRVAEERDEYLRVEHHGWLEWRITE
jgi:hypothetical protein